PSRSVSVTVDCGMSSQVVPLEQGEATARSLESGNVLWQRQGFFTVDAREAPLFSPSVLAGGKNVSFDPASGQLGGTAVAGQLSSALGGMLSRFSDEAHRFVQQRCPHYAPRLVRGRTSFRPVEIAGRPSSWRKDDTRLHIDAFPATPVQGRRIL